MGVTIRAKPLRSPSLVACSTYRPWTLIPTMNYLTAAKSWFRQFSLPYCGLISTVRRRFLVQRRDRNRLVREWSLFYSAIRSCLRGDGCRSRGVRNERPSVLLRRIQRVLTGAISIKVSPGVTLSRFTCSLATQAAALTIRLGLCGGRRGLYALSWMRRTCSRLPNFCISGNVVKCSLEMRCLYLGWRLRYVRFSWSIRG